MAAFNLAPVGNWFSNFGSNTAGSNPNLPLSGGKLYTYAAGTTTPIPVYTTNVGVVWTNPIILGADGRVPGSIWLASGNAYKFVLQDSLGNPIPNGTLDNIIGINDTSGSGAVSEWVVTGLVPTFASATTFTTLGNTTSTFQVGRRVQATVTAGTVYGTITSSVFGAVTTVTLRMDSGQALDAGLSSVNVGFLNATEPSVPMFNYPTTNSGQPAFHAHLGSNQTSGTTVICGTVDNQQGSGYNAGTGIFTAPVTGFYLLAGCVQWTSSSTGLNNVAYLTVNGNQISSGTVVSIGGVTQQSISTVINMTVGQTATLNVLNAFTGTNTGLAGTATNFSGALLF